MKKNAFTLAELLGVLLILALLAFITVPVVNNSIKSSKEKAYKEQINRIIDAFKGYTTKYSSKVEYVDNVYKMEVRNLKKTEFLNDEIILDPRDKTEILGCVYITRSSNRVKHSYKATCD